MTEAVQENNQPGFNIEKIYVKDLSLEIPHAPGIFLERESPQIDLQLNTNNAALGEDLYEVSIVITITSRIGEKVMFLIEAKQAGIFRITHMTAEEMDPILGAVCPNILYPYLHELISSVAVRAGFLPVVLNPINFEVLYHQQKQANAAQADAAKASVH
jgi:preprotein translocase subunit SecB